MRVLNKHATAFYDEPTYPSGAYQRHVVMNGVVSGSGADLEPDP